MRGRLQELEVLSGCAKQCAGDGCAINVPGSFLGNRFKVRAHTFEAIRPLWEVWKKRVRHGWTLPQYISYCLNARLFTPQRGFSLGMPPKMVQGSETKSSKVDQVDSRCWNNH